VINRIYDAALDAALWTRALESVNSFLNCAYTTIGSYDAIQPGLTFNHIFGDNPEYTQLYLDKYAAMNPGLAATLSSRVGEVVSITDLMSYEEVRRLPLYTEWCAPQGYVDIAQTTLEKSGTAIAVLAAVRHEDVGLVDAQMLRRLKLLSPHLRRAILIGKVIELKTVQAQAFAETVDGLAAGVFLVDPRGRLVHANAAGAALLEEADAVRLAGGVVTAVGARADEALREAMAAASGGEDADLARRAGGVPMFGASGQSYIAHVLPLAAGARRPVGLSSVAAAAVFLRRATLDLGPAVAAVARQYGLTPTEARVLQTVTDHGGVTAIAEQLGMSEATVKTHLQRLFKKTGASRQVDLVKLAFSFTDPLDA
jgi:DNA-binding CsgD family transcriptional regulator/PAS domain-containing protein